MFNIEQSMFDAFTGIPYEREESFGPAGHPDHAVTPVRGKA